MAGVLIEEKDNDRLKALGVKDSKEILPNKRKELFTKVKELVKKYEILTVSPQEIDNAVLSKTSNLNWLEAEKSVEIITKLKPDVAILDCPSNNITAYKNFVQKELKKRNLNTKLIVEHKADQNYPSSSAASILAKVTRDNVIEKIKKQVKVDLGSGYPSDPKTQRFLKEHYSKFPQIFRKSWSTVQKLYQTKSQTKLGNF
jgi:ribonuclease HII